MPPTPRPTLYKLLPCLLLLALTSCLKIPKPLSDPTTSKHDDNLPGIWQNKKDPADFLFIGLVKKADPADPDPLPGLMAVARVTYAPRDKSVYAPAAIPFTITPIADNTYANMYHADAIGAPARISDPKSYEAWLANPDHNCVIARYKLDAKSLTVWQGDDKAKSDLKITTPESLAAALTPANLPLLFPEKTRTDYTRLPDR